MMVARWSTAFLCAASGLAWVACGNEFSSHGAPKNPDAGTGGTGTGGAASGGQSGVSGGGQSSGGSPMVTPNGGAPGQAVTCGGNVCAALSAACTGARRCCTPDLACGVTSSSVGGACVQQNQQGGIDAKCPGATLGSMGLRGCCRPDGTCGGLDDLCGGGCISAVELGSTAKSCQHDPQTDCFVNGVNRCAPDGGTIVVPPGTDGGTEPTGKDGGTVVTGGAYRVETTQVLAPIQGRLATPAPGQADIANYGTDLGFPVVQGSTLRLLFGDTWPDTSGPIIGTTADDTVGDISLTQFPTGDSVEQYVFAHPPKAGQLSYQRGGPPLKMAVGSDGKAAPIVVTRDGRAIDMGAFKTPTAVFSNARGATFALFSRVVLTPCSGGTCSTGLTCDTGLGACAATLGDNRIPCKIGTDRCVCAPVTGGGLCQDPTSSVYKNDEDGRVLSIALVTDVGNADPNVPTSYKSQAWTNNKFYNPAVATVNDFDASRANGAGDDYRLADGVDPSHEKVLLWGRPGFAGPRGKGRDARLYLAYADMPDYDATGHFSWAPHYFTGVNGGKPQFSTDQSAAVPLDLSGKNEPTEIYDIVNQMSIVWVDAIKQWVMFYGGDLPDSVLDLLLGPGKADIVRDLQGAIHARFAKLPWGPWSPPVTVLEGGNPAGTIAGTQYGSGGILYHPDCKTDCAPTEPSLDGAAGNYGRLYGAAIIGAWTADRGHGSADLYWNVSTLNPYGTVLMKSRLTH
jgi:hypothetical protein